MLFFRPETHSRSFVHEDACLARTLYDTYMFTRKEQVLFFCGHMPAVVAPKLVKEDVPLANPNAKSPYDTIPTGAGR